VSATFSADPSTVIGVVQVVLTIVGVRVQVNVRDEVNAAYRSSPACVATMVHFDVSAGAPATACAAYPPLEVVTTEHVAGVDDVSVTASPELAETESGFRSEISRLGGVAKLRD
jgi:hypothetical protein